MSAYLRRGSRRTSRRLRSFLTQIKENGIRRGSRQQAQPSQRDPDTHRDEVVWVPGHQTSGPKTPPSSVALNGLSHKDSITIYQSSIAPNAINSIATKLATRYALSSCHCGAGASPARRGPRNFSRRRALTHCCDWCSSSTSARTGCAGRPRISEAATHSELSIPTRHSSLATQAIAGIGSSFAGGRWTS